MVKFLAKSALVLGALVCVVSAAQPAKQPAQPAQPAQKVAQEWTGYKSAQDSYNAMCGHCHRGGAVGPNTVNVDFGADALKDRAAQIKTIVRNGFNAMPPFRKTEINDKELDALANELAKGALK